MAAAEATALAAAEVAAPGVFLLPAPGGAYVLDVRNAASPQVKFRPVSALQRGCSVVTTIEAKDVAAVAGPTGVSLVRLQDTASGAKQEVVTLTATLPTACCWLPPAPPAPPTLLLPEVSALTGKQQQQQVIRVEVRVPGHTVDASAFYPMPTSGPVTHLVADDHLVAALSAPCLRAWHTDGAGAPVEMYEATLPETDAKIVQLLVVSKHKLAIATSAGVLLWRIGRGDSSDSSVMDCVYHAPAGTVITSAAVVDVDGGSEGVVLVATSAKQLLVLGRGPVTLPPDLEQLPARVILPINQHLVLIDQSWDEAVIFDRSAGTAVSRVSLAACRLAAAGLSVRWLDAGEAVSTFQQVGQLFRDYHIWLGVDLSFQNFEAEVAALPGQYASAAGGAMLSAWAGDKPVGVVSYRALPSVAQDACEMKRLFILPEARRAGLGRHMVRQLLHHARRAGYRHMYLDTLAHMTSARDLYAGAGFVECPAYYHNPLPNPVFYRYDLK